MSYEDKVIVDVSDAAGNCFFNSILISLQRGYPNFKFLDKVITSYNNNTFTEAIKIFHLSEKNTIKTQAIELDPRIEDIYRQDIYSSQCNVFDNLTITYIARLLKIQILTIERTESSGLLFKSFNNKAQSPSINIWCNKYNKSHYKGIIHISQVRSGDKTYEVTPLFNSLTPIPNELAVIPELVQKINATKPVAAAAAAPAQTVVLTTPHAQITRIHGADERPQNIILPRNYGTLENVGNSCYLNTTLQLLYRIHSLRHALENINIDTLQRNPRISQAVFENSKTLIIILKRIFEEFTRGNRSIDLNTLVIGNIRNAYTTLVKITKLTCGAQEDMTEFLVPLISQFEPLYNNEDIRNFIISITHNQIITTYCQNRKILITNKYEVNDSPDPERKILDLDRVLQLQLLGSSSNLQELINNYQQRENIRLGDVVFDGCIIRNDAGEIIDNNRNATQQERRITNLPNASDYYIISLKRFGVNRDATGRAISRYKIFDPIQVNPILRIHNRNYQIMGCGLHMGNVNGGHYVYIDYHNGEPVHTYNDSRDYPITPYESKEIITGGYVFLYKNIGSSTEIMRQPDIVRPAAITQSLPLFNPLFKTTTTTSTSIGITASAGPPPVIKSQGNIQSLTAKPSPPPPPPPPPVAAKPSPPPVAAPAPTPNNSYTAITARAGPPPVISSRK